MKPIIVKSRNRVLLAGAAICVASMMVAQASSTFVTFSVDMSTNVLLGTFVPGTDVIAARGTFNGYGTFNLVQDTSQLPEYIYTNTVNDTSDANGGELQYKFYDSNASSVGWENPATGQNRAALLPSTSGASLVLPTAFFSDAGAPVTNLVNFQVDISQQVNLGNFVPGTSSVEVRGFFNSWTGGATPLTQSAITVPGEPAGSVWTGSYLVAGSPGGAEAFKYVIQPGTGWDSPASVNQNGGGNRYFANVAQTLPVVNFSDSPFSLQFCTNIFSVDMSAVVLTDTNFNPASLTINGSFNGWGSGVTMTNNPTAANTNIYSNSQTILSGAGSPVYYQFRYTQLSNPANIVYDHLNGINGGSGNRTFVEPLSITFTSVPAVFFNDAALDDYLTQPTPVFFSVDMTSAVGVNSDLGHAFNPSADNVYINGQFANWYAWANGANPSPAPAGFQLIEQGLTAPFIYTNTIIIPAGTPVGFAYKYGMDPNATGGGPDDDEAASGVNHYRVVRSTAFNPYVMPTDTFGNMYDEPFFSVNSTGGADLSVGTPVAGKVPVTWLGRPGAHLQVKSDLVSGSWQDLAATDGTNWTAGSSSTNGFVSQTNWPASSKAFFRLVKP
jgi:hypothetical protein